MTERFNHQPRSTEKTPRSSRQGGIDGGGEHVVQRRMMLSKVKQAESEMARII